MTDLIATLGGLISSLGNVQSAAVLKERLALAADQLELVRAEVADLRAELVDARSQLAAAAQRELQLQQQLQGLQAGGDALARTKGWRCDGCGGAGLERVGARADPTFSMFGVKLLQYRCVSCQAVSEFQFDPGK